MENPVGHGTHWEAVLTNLDEDFAVAIELGIQKGDVVGKRHYESWSGPMGEQAADVTLIQNAKSRLWRSWYCCFRRFEDLPAQCVSHRGTADSSSRSRRGDPRVQLWRLEACITAEIGDARINFFEPYYALQSELYYPGAELDVSLAGIVYVLSVPARGQTVMHPEIGQTHLDGAAVLLPIKQPAPPALPANGFGLSYVQSGQDRPGLDDYRFRGAVRQIEYAEFLGRAPLGMTATVIRFENGERDIDINLCVLDDKIDDGKTPVLGGDVTGVLWLQGISHPHTDHKVSVPLAIAQC